ncbi:hypothetical protein SAMD00019534_121360 [Acytostelium subglobosum LB1]|uniref:hypothetical protein n=1 Tax=Acytostelium subglobosum LB1 TaxID=1410327 RepID=UPI000644D7F5|nr:hypothetical protein SAMD00019534_121360 [Acytostelium subglobosum LB1]GAM28960.1 hypothetical protein SAMD00019534_121360 [Acytostelium subglobosum LB1]|eukprot:XP_012748145.1 hypothetical protein SAMD00019534_121360 [Acytostelium subglobosum LB1]
MLSVLSTYLLRIIVSQLDDNVDRILLSLTCRRLFDERQHYLIFEKKDIILDLTVLALQSSQCNRFILKSFKEQLIQSLAHFGGTCHVAHCTIPGPIPAHTKRLWIANPNFQSEHSNIPNGVECLTFEYVNGRTIESDIDAKFTYNITVGTIPSSVTEVHFDYGVEVLHNGVIPSSVEKLSITGQHPKWVDIRPGAIPNSVTDLRLNGCGALNLDNGLIPNSVVNLFIEPGWIVEFSLLPGYIPSSVRSLTFGEGFKEEISPHVLPQSLTQLHFGNMADKWLYVGSIPSSVHTLHFGYYNLPLDQDGVLPSSLTKLIFQIGFSNRLPQASALPSLQTLSMPRWNDKKGQFALDLPPTLSSLVIGYVPTYCTALPISLTHLLIESPSLSLGVIPESVTDLSLDIVKRIVLGAIPPNVSTLSIERVDEELCTGMIPASVRVLRFGNSHRGPLLPGSIPFGVHTLDTPKWYKYPITVGLLPESLTTLSLWDQAIEAGALPASIKVLKIHSFGPHLPDELGLLVDTIELSEDFRIRTLDIHRYLDAARQVKFQYNGFNMCIRRLDGEWPPYFLYSDQVIHASGFITDMLCHTLCSDNKRSDEALKACLDRLTISSAGSWGLD